MTGGRIGGMAKNDNTIRVDRGDLFDLIQAAYAALEHAAEVMPTVGPADVARMRAAEEKLRDQLLAF